MVPGQAVKIELTFLSDWHIGTGGGIPGIADRSILRDAEGFPYIPGRTLRGIFRDAHEKLFSLPHLKENILSPVEVWGARQQDKDTSGFRQGRWQVSNGVLNKQLRDQLLQASPDVRHIWLDEFTFIVPRIALNPRKRVRENHLAFIEMGRKGLTFTFTLSRLDNSPFDEKERYLLRLLSLFVQRLGGTRRRGKGRVKLSISLDKNRQETLTQILGGKK